MAGYTLATGDTSTRKRWLEREFAIEVESETFWDRYMGNDENAVIQRVTDLSKAKGDTVTYELVRQLRGTGRRGRAQLKGYEEALVIYPDSVSIDQLRHATLVEGRMTAQRTDLDIMKLGKKALKKWATAVCEEELFAQFGGKVGTNHLYLPDGYTGHAGNTITSGSSNHTIYGGDATSEATIDETCKPGLELIERFAAKTATLETEMPPARVEGDEWHVWVVHPFQMFWLRQAAGEGEFRQLMSDLTTYEGRKSPIFKGGKFVYNGVVVVPHKKVPLFTNDDGVQCAASFFLGRQAGVWANGNGGEGEKAMFEIEEKDDYGENTGVAVSMAWGAKKTRFNSEDFGSMQCITAAPTPAGV